MKVCILVKDNNSQNIILLTKWFEWECCACSWILSSWKAVKKIPQIPNSTTQYHTSMQLCRLPELTNVLQLNKARKKFVSTHQSLGYILNNIFRADSFYNFNLTLCCNVIKCPPRKRSFLLTVHFPFIWQNDFPSAAWWINCKGFLEALLNIRRPYSLGIGTYYLFIVLKLLKYFG